MLDLALPTSGAQLQKQPGKPVENRHAAGRLCLASQAGQELQDVNNRSVSACTMMSTSWASRQGPARPLARLRHVQGLLAHACGQTPVTAGWLLFHRVAAPVLADPMHHTPLVGYAHAVCCTAQAVLKALECQACCHQWHGTFRGELRADSAGMLASLGGWVSPPGRPGWGLRTAAGWQPRPAQWRHPAPPANAGWPIYAQH